MVYAHALFPFPVSLPFYCLYKPVHNNENEILVTLLKPFTASTNSAVHSDTTKALYHS